LRSGNAYTLSDAYKDSIKLSSAENAGLYNVYTFDSAASGSFEIASLAENNVINVVFAKVDGLYYDYETFSNVTDDWGFVEGRSGNVNVLADGTLQLYAGSGTSGSQQKSDVKTLDASIAAATKLTVGFDWKCTSDKNRSSLFNLTDANDNIILSLYGGGTDGSYYKVGAAAAKTDTKIASSSKNEWLRVELNLDFEANIVSGKIINLTKNTEYAIPQTVITADNLAIMKTAYGFSAAPQVIDNVFFKANTEESSTGTLQVDKNVGSVEGDLGEDIDDSLFF